MCGLFGFSGFHAGDLESAKNATKTLAHRGPDQSSAWYNNDVYMSHTRLSIIDTSVTGIQPMVNSSNDVVVAVNGEIYNYRTIRQELLGKGYLFKGSSDSEIVLHGYIEWGLEGLINLIEGMFAISIYDAVQNQIHLVRDRVGIKPIYYGVVRDRVFWASELKAIEKMCPNELQVDGTAIYDYLTYLYVPAPKTIYQEINKLEPATYITFQLDSNKVIKNKYWELSCRPITIELEEAKVRLRELIKKSVSAQMISDVPIGFFLSGGVDSSIVVAEASKLSDEVHSYAIGFDDSRHDETRYAEIVSKTLGIKCEKKILSKDDAKEMYGYMYKWFGEPFADTSAFPTYLVSKFARKNVKVVLTGDGGDEVFGGYNWYLKFKYYQRFKKLFIPGLKDPIEKIAKNRKNIYVKKILNRLQYYCCYNEFETYTKLMSGMIASEKINYKSQLEIPDDYDDYWYFRKYYNNKLPMLTRMQYMDFHTYLPDDILTKVDRVSMAVSLECRVPLLSTELIEFSFSLPEKIRFDRNQLKGLVKSAYQDLLPAEILNRPKKGFSIPEKSWKSTLHNYNYNRQESLLYGPFLKFLG